MRAPPVPPTNHAAGPSAAGADPFTTGSHGAAGLDAAAGRHIGVGPDAAGPVLLSVRDLSVSFGHGADRAVVVDRVSFDIARGEKFALVGESGSGKTMTALGILRLAGDPLAGGAALSGQVLLDGEDLLAKSERQMRAIRGKDVAMVFQEPMTALDPLYSVGDQIGETLELHEGLSRRAARARAIELLDRTGIPEPARRCDSYPHQLSGGQRQRAMIAMALACRPRLLIADEPTTALDVAIQRQIVELLRELQREFGMSVLLITHDLNLVRAFADRVGVMRAGRLVEAAPTETLFASPRQDYTRQLIDSRPVRAVEPVPAAAPVLLEARDVRCRFWIRRGWFSRSAFDAVHDASLTVARGQTLGIVGESGSGKTTLGMALLRLSQAQVTGAIEFGGQRIDGMPAEAMRALRRRMQVVFQDPFSSLSPRLTVEQIVGEGLALHRPDLGRAQRRDAVVAVLEEVGLTGAILPRYPHEFSGGQRQRIAIARAVVLQPELLLLDEPTSALDVSVQKQVLELLAGLQRRHGMSYLLITHDLSVIGAMAHRVIVLQGGRIVEAGEVDEVLRAPRNDYTRMLLAGIGADAA